MGQRKAELLLQEQPAMNETLAQRDTHPKPTTDVSHWGVTKELLAAVASKSSTFGQCLPPQLINYPLPCCGTLLVLRLRCEQDDRTNADIKANFAMKMLRFLLGLELKKDRQFPRPAQFSSRNKLLEWRQMKIPSI